ncbi:MAG: hypothetical protein KUL82_05580 [Bdellovibrio sp.]|nr:hypothetical protein [Bdellovibrio sp.]
MHRIQIFRALILIFLLGGSVAGAAKVDVYSEFQKKIAKLETDLKKEKDITKKYDSFLKSYRELSDLRAKNPRQAEEKELNMSLFMDSLAFLPEKKEFQAKKCRDYKKEVTAMMQSYSKDQKEPFVERAFKVVDLICK